jgi:hypothetical protein
VAVKTAFYIRAFWLLALSLAASAPSFAEDEEAAEEGFEVSELSAEDIQSGKVIICAAAANAAYKNNGMAENLMQSCVSAIKASGGPKISPGTPGSPAPAAAPQGNSASASGFPPGKAKKIFKEFEKNFNMGKGQLTRSLKQPGSIAAFRDMLRENMPAASYSKVEGTLEKAETAEAKEKEKKDGEGDYEYKTGHGGNKLNKSLRDSLKDHLGDSFAAGKPSKKSGGGKRGKGKDDDRQPASASGDVFTATDLKDERLSPEDEALFSLKSPEEEQSAEEEEDEEDAGMTLFEVVKRKYREKFEMMDPKAFRPTPKAPNNL